MCDVEHKINRNAPSEVFSSKFIPAVTDRKLHCAVLRGKDRRITRVIEPVETRL